MHLQFIAENRPVYFIQDILMKRRRNNKEKYPRSGSDKYNNPKDYMGTRKKPIPSNILKSLTGKSLLYITN